VSDTEQPAWARHLSWLLFALGALLLALGLIAIAGVVLKEGVIAELMALAGMAIAIPAMTVGIIAFVMLIYARLRQILSKDSE
jgi:Mg2+/Co2+ transporter CorB